MCIKEQPTSAGQEKQEAAGKKSDVVYTAGAHQAAELATTTGTETGDAVCGAEAAKKCHSAKIWWRKTPTKTQGGAAAGGAGGAWGAAQGMSVAGADQGKHLALGTF